MCNLQRQILAQDREAQLTELRAWLSAAVEPLQKTASIAYVGNTNEIELTGLHSRAGDVYLNDARVTLTVKELQVPMWKARTGQS